jgi:hypothetical protein
MAAALPAADLYALTREPGVPFGFGDRRPRTTFLDRPSIRGHRQLLLPFMPLAWRYATRGRYDLVITSSHACAKGFWPGSGKPPAPAGRWVTSSTTAAPCTPRRGTPTAGATTTRAA